MLVEFNNILISIYPIIIQYSNIYGIVLGATINYDPKYYNFLSLGI